MPQLKPLEINDGSAVVNYPIDGNSQGVTAWRKPDGNLRGGNTIVLTKRDAKSSQTTRKSSLAMTFPLIKTCETTCNIVSRGTVLAKLEFISSVDSTVDERSAALASLKSALADQDIADALVNNESFWS